jgi:hypothetical protein
LEVELKRAGVPHDTYGKFFGDFKTNIYQFYGGERELVNLKMQDGNSKTAFWLSFPYVEIAISARIAQTTCKLSVPIKGFVYLM